MSWNPDIWMKSSDYEKVKDKLPKEIRAYKFNILGQDGVVIFHGESSSINRDADDVLEKEKIPHWLLNGEGANCDYCNEWGELIE